MIFPGREFEKASCKDADVDKQMLALMFDKMTEEKYNVHAMILVKDGAKVFEAYADGFGPETKSETYSIAKSFVSVAVGMLVDRGILKLEEPIIPLFRNSITACLPEYEHLTTKHLLTMTVDHGVDHIEDLKTKVNPIQLFFSLPLASPLGTKFHYNNFSTFMLSQIVTKLTGKSVNDFLELNLYHKIGIEKPVWDELKGVSFGAFGLKISATDMAKFGLLLANDGVWKNETIISSRYLHLATSNLVSTGFVDNLKDRYGYGFQFWINQFGDFRCAGLYKQYIVINREHHVVFVTQAYEQREVLDLFSSYVLPALDKGYEYSIVTLREHIALFQENSKSIIAAEIASRTLPY